MNNHDPTSPLELLCWIALMLLMSMGVGFVILYFGLPFLDWLASR